MALSSAQVWEVRAASGSDLNGGAFKAGSAGTDYSQQAAPQVSFTDLTIGATATQLSSSANPFNATHVGNVLNITGGAGFTAGRYEVVSVSNGVATMDRAVGTANTVGGSGNLGGALASLGAACGAAVNGNVIWATGTFAPTGGFLSIPGGVSAVGYGAARGDGARCSFSGASQDASSDAIRLGIGAAVVNFAISGAKANGVYCVSGPVAYAVNCTASGAATAGFQGINAITCTANGSAAFGFYNCHCYGCFAYSNTQSGFFAAGGYAWVSCVSRGNTVHGFATSGTYLTFADRCVAYANAQHGFYVAPGGPLLNCVAFANGGNGFLLSAAATGHVGLRGCYAGFNSAGDVVNPNPALDGGSVTILATQPFADPNGSPAASYLPNTNPGGGALLRGGGWSPPTPGLYGTGNPDAGAFQHQDAGVINIFHLEG